MFWRGETCYFWWMPHTTIWYVFMWAWWAWTLIDSSFHKHDENNSPTVYIYIISQQQRGTSIAIFLFQPNCYFLAFEPDSPLGIPRRTQLGTFCWIMLWRWKKDHNTTFDFGIAGGRIQCLIWSQEICEHLVIIALARHDQSLAASDHQHECELD